MMDKAKKFNTDYAVTGCQLHHNQKFVQLLEGEEKIVRTLVGEIGKDARHKDMVLLNLEENNFPLFSKFGMVYNNLDDMCNQIGHKRMTFDQIFHDSEIVKSPGSSKLTLWGKVNKLLAQKGNLILG